MPDLRPDRPVARWRALVCRDPVNLQEYLTAVLAHHLGCPRPRARALTARILESGSAEVCRGVREYVEAEAMALQSYGLRIRVEPAP